MDGAVRLFGDIGVIGDRNHLSRFGSSCRIRPYGRMQLPLVYVPLYESDRRETRPDDFPLLPVECEVQFGYIGKRTTVHSFARSGVDGRLVSRFRREYTKHVRDSVWNHQVHKDK